MNQITTQTFSETEQNTLKLFEAINHKDEKTALALIDDGICIDMNIPQIDPRIKFTPLSYAVKMGLSSVALKLIKNGADIHVDYPGMYETITDAACQKCSKDVVIALIEKGATIEHKENIKNEWLPDIQKTRQTYQEKHRQDIQKQLNALIALSTTTNLWDRMETTDKEDVIRALSKHLTLEEKRFLINQRNPKDNC
ncbi:MAG: ankyrin repeat domain-containing protein [Alphaproteobacteria bacterium]|nr:ankyrin repeat domain-containing protein [Alphaproteobacteria bacterium]